MPARRAITVRLINETKNKIVATDIFMANTFWLRLRGLLGRTALPPYHALILQPCASVHTCFMKYPIDVIFLSVNGKVIHLQENMVPWRCSPVVQESSTVVELWAGGIRAGKILPGDTLSFHQ